MTIKLAHGIAKVEKNRFGSYVHIVMVDPEYRGNGIATKLMNKILDKAPRPIYLLACGE
ncbi:MAG: GNAT family N-acetyltransferase, partial [Lentisphaeria bacterium]|nr:GNAT family N-acetyltransferase [Lentisphaeria bacterium]